MGFQHEEVPAETAGPDRPVGREKDQGPAVERTNIDGLHFRRAGLGDTATVLHFIQALAEYEKMADEVVATEELLQSELFEKNRAEVIFAMMDGKEVGFALYFHNFSTFLGRSGLYLEDLFVLEEYRGRGIGKALLRYLAAIAVERGCGRMEWWCLDWNRPSIDFYRSLGAEAMDEWTVYRISGERLLDMAKELDVPGFDIDAV